MSIHSWRATCLLVNNFIWSSIMGVHMAKHSSSHNMVQIWHRSECCQDQFIHPPGLPARREHLCLALSFVVELMRLPSLMTSITIGRLWTTDSIGCGSTITRGSVHIPLVPKCVKILNMFSGRWKHVVRYEACKTYWYADCHSICLLSENTGKATSCMGCYITWGRMST